MNVEKAITERRSIRNFSQKKIPLSILKKLINAARLAPSAANRQFLEYLLVTKPDLCKAVFKQLAWAGYIAPRGNPKPGHEPRAYIVILINTRKASTYDLRDVGAAAENIMLLAQSRGIGTCWLGSIKRPRLREILAITKHYTIDTIVALGYPEMRSAIAPFKGSIKYYLDQRGNFRVPKRPMNSILHSNTISP
jgi:nitroreductase